MDLFNRLQGIFFNPKLTFKAISEKPVWIDTPITLLYIAGSLLFPRSMH